MQYTSADCGHHLEELAGSNGWQLHIRSVELAAWNLSSELMARFANARQPDGPGNKRVPVTGGLEVAQFWQKSHGAADYSSLWGGSRLSADIRPGAENWPSPIQC